jgi:hypothetical protein
MTFLRKKSRLRKIAVFMVGLLLFQTSNPLLVFGLTSGPGQPEFQGFQQAGNTEMVDLFTGNFSYNIPLFELPGPNGGYPFNLSYQSGIGMDQEASWVGLGWSLNPGAINRQMRGLPDEFRGDNDQRTDQITKTMSMKPSKTLGVGGGVNVELWGRVVGIDRGLTAFSNNYRGIGYSIDGSLDFSMATNSGLTAGLGFSLNSQEGISLSPSLGLSQKIHGSFHTASLSLGVGYNSRQGLQGMTLGTSFERYASYKDKDGNYGIRNAKGAGSSFLSFANHVGVPQIGLPMENSSVSFKGKVGGAWWGVYGSAYIKGFYNKQKLKNDKVPVVVPAYGYLNYEFATETDALLDLNREKDGLVTNEIPNLPIPSLTYDIYSVNGQGMSAMYRPFRNDIAMIYDPYRESTTDSRSLGIDLGPAFAHVGLNASLNMAESTSGLWSANNDLIPTLRFQSKKENDPYEPWYFKVHGEKTAESSDFLEPFADITPIRAKLYDSKSNPGIEATFVNPSTGTNFNVPDNEDFNQERKPRSQVIHPITNEALMGSEAELIDLYKVKYIDARGTEDDLERSGYPSNHLAGMSVVTPEGLRYIYALPAYNHKQEEVQFSAQAPGPSETRTNVGDGGQGLPFFEHGDTEQFLDKTEIPEFAHSYLLTSIVGPDYVDRTNDGVTIDDLGYWVKFTYQRSTSPADPYKWRTPFSKAIYQRGLRNNDEDDKGMYTYGEKDIWYLQKAETRSHVAEFILSEREDGIGARESRQDQNFLGKKLKKLDQIVLYSQFTSDDPIPIKRVKFHYEEENPLCPGAENSTDKAGKLTLKKVWFEYGLSTKGEFNPYVFTYHDNNPSYDMNAYDRWGNYKPYPQDDIWYNQDFPFTEQDPSKKDEIDRNAAAWSLKEVRLPSGGKIIIDYETDDYAYVQYRQAMQMTEIVHPTDRTNRTLQIDDSDLKVFFKLEQPLPIESIEDEEDEVMKYIDTETWQMYFRALINLRAPHEPYFEFISGYADIDPDGEMGLQIDEADPSHYAYGYFYLKKEEERHPISLRAWQHLRVNEPDVASIAKPNSNPENGIIESIYALGSIVMQVKQMFTGFYDYCDNHEWGRQLTLGKSWIRLKSPDKIKYGGGLRVKQITLFDNWAEDEEGISGQVYQYTTEEDGETISSGVALNEPMIGGEENALRYARKYTESVPLRSNNNLFSEYPINESYYPGAQVGYSKVTVMSLASAHRQGLEILNARLSDEEGLYPEGENIRFGTSGASVHEFFTGRDFPVISTETDKLDKPDKMVIPHILGTVSASKLSSSQGYCILTNDMHGKPKITSHFRQADDGSIEKDPISWVRYNYQSENQTYGKKQVKVLSNLMKDNQDNTISALTLGELNDLDIDKVYFGQEQEIFVDARQHKDHSWEAGGNLNVDFNVVPTAFYRSDCAGTKFLAECRRAQKRAEYRRHQQGHLPFGHPKECRSL